MKYLSIILLAGLMLGCSMSPIISQGVGTLNNQKYLVRLSIIPDGFENHAKIEINGTEVLFIERLEIFVGKKDTENCIYPDHWTWDCKYSAYYKGIPVTVHRHPNANRQNQFDIYLDGEFLTNIND